MKQEIFEQLKEIIYDYLGDDEIEIKQDSNFINDIGLSSLDMISIVGQVEDTFDIVVEDDDMSKIKTMEDAVNYIEEKKEISDESCEE